MPRAGPAVVVIGVGNPDRGDDGAGPAVARQVRAALTAGGLAHPRDVRVLECDGEASGLMEAWDGAPTVILIDAVRSGAPPGHLHRIDAHRQPIAAGGWGFRASTHAFGVAEAVALARALGRLPARLILYGIEGKTFDAGAGLSVEVAAAVPTAATRVISDVVSPI